MLDRTRTMAGVKCLRSRVEGILKENAFTSYDEVNGGHMMVWRVR